MSPGGVPERVTWALELLAPEPGQRVLELGCGAGVAVELLVEAVGPEGFVAAVDRSATAVGKARARNAAHVDSGRARVEQLAIDAVDDLALGEPVDAALAINVNAFWTGDAAGELAALRRALRPGAPLLVVYESPGTVRRDALKHTAENLADNDFDAEVLEGPTPSLAAVRATAR